MQIFERANEDRVDGRRTAKACLLDGPVGEKDAKNWLLGWLAAKPNRSDFFHKERGISNPLLAQLLLGWWWYKAEIRPGNESTLRGRPAACVGSGWASKIKPVPYILLTSE